MGIDINASSGSLESEKSCFLLHVFYSCMFFARRKCDFESASEGIGALASAGAYSMPDLCPGHACGERRRLGLQRVAVGRLGRELCLPLPFGLLALELLLLRLCDAWLACERTASGSTSTARARSAAATGTSLSTGGSATAADASASAATSALGQSVGSEWE